MRLWDPERGKEPGTRDAFSEDELAQPRGFPEINRVELIRHFTVTGC